MTPSQTLLTLVPVAYLAGSIPFGLLVGLSRGVDPRKTGSGNIGATNVGRLLGGRFFALVFTLDFLKGLLPTLAAGWVLRNSGSMPYDHASYSLWLLVGFAAIIGHMFSLFISFKGGKGVATSAGVMLGVFPYFTLAGGIAMVIWLIAFKLTRYVSLASIIGAFGFTLSYLILGLTMNWDIFGRQLPLLAFAILVTAMILMKHRTNIFRLRAGTEHRIGTKAPSHT